MQEQLDGSKSIIGSIVNFESGGCGPTVTLCINHDQLEHGFGNFERVAAEYHN